jgi:hypothetical protein
MGRLTTLQAIALGALLLCMIVAAGVLDRRLPLHGLVSRLWRRLKPPSEAIEGYQHPELVDVVFRKASANIARGE